MTDQPACCAEYERVSGISRRRFLAGMAATTGAVVATQMFGDALRQTTYGATPGGNVLVVLSLRGGVDGLGLVVPHGDPAYYTARPRIAVPADRLVAADAMFGLHPAMRPLAWLWDSGELAAVHAVGMDAPNRSHFEAMELVEEADPTSSVRRGWVNRMIGLDAVQDPVDAVNLGSPLTPTSLVGPAPTLSAATLSDITLAGASHGFEARRRQQLVTRWQDDTGLLGQATRSALATLDEVGGLPTETYQPQNGAVYPTSGAATGLASALRDTAHLIRADIGTSVVTVDFGSWDMHADYGSADSGGMTGMVAALAAAVSAFMTDLGALRQRVTVVTISEFGRRVAENGNRGLDHGWGNAMLLLGAGVDGGKYHASWPGLGSTNLLDGDLQVTVDYRDVLAEVVTSRFPDRAVSSVFPGLTYRPAGVMRPAV